MLIGRHTDAKHPDPRDDYESADLETETNVEPRFCFACGILDAESDQCDCGAPIEQLGWSPSRVGSVYKTPGLFGKTGVVVIDGDPVTLVLEPDKITEVPSRKLDRSEVLLDMSSVPSEMFRLQSISERTETWAKGVASWLEQAGSSLLSTWADRRLFARSAIAADKSDLAEGSGLPRDEITWLEMHAAHTAEAHLVAAERALALPDGRFPDKSTILLSALLDGGWEPSASDERRIDGWPTDSAASCALKAALGLELDLGEWERVLANLPEESGVFDRRWVELMVVGEPGQSLSERDRDTIERVARNGDDHALCERALAGRFGASLQVDDDDIEALFSDFPSATDDLIDRGVLDLVGQAETLSKELRARLAPESLTSEELEDAEMQWEAARRIYVSGGLKEFPAGPAGDHFRALLAMRNHDTSLANEIQDSDGTASAVARSIESQSIDATALTDPTTWSVLESIEGFWDAIGESSDSDAWLLGRALQAVLAWDWEAAGEMARHALRASSDEGVRDEALNVIAFVRYQGEEDESAVSALEKALDGEYTASLQANAGIVAEHLAPQKAAHHLGRLASEAPSTDLKLAAVRRAFRIWNTTRLAWEDEMDLPSTPEGLLNAVRELATADIDLDDFGEVMRLLANFDDDWLADESNTDSSPHHDSWERRVFVAKSGGDPEDFIEAVAAGLKSGYEADWLLSERDSMVEGLRTLIFEDIEHLGPATYAFIAIDKGLPMTHWNRLVLSCGALVSICRSLVSQDGLPSDQVVKMFEDARGSVPDLEAEQQEQVKDLIMVAGNTLAHAIAAGREEMLRQGYEALGTMFSQLEGVPMRRINWAGVTEAFRPMRVMADESINDLSRAKTYVSAEELAEAIDNVIKGFRELRGFAANPRSAF